MCGTHDPGPLITSWRADRPKIGLKYIRKMMCCNVEMTTEGDSLPEYGYLTKLYYRLVITSAILLESPTTGLQIQTT